MSLRRVRWMSLALPIAVLIGACGGADGPVAQPSTTATSSPEDSHRLRIEATEYEFTIATSVPAGLYDFRLVNKGKETHHAQLYRLKEGVTYQEFAQALLSNPASSTSLVEPPPTGVLGLVAPKETGIGKGRLESGVYALLCSLDTSTGSNHFAIGMLAELRVT